MDMVQGMVMVKHDTVALYPPQQYASRGRSANDLAWERHSYYQQQHQYEQTIVEQNRRRESALSQNGAPWQLQQQDQNQDQDLTTRKDSVNGTKSLSRLTASSLSPKAAQALGLSRSKTIAGRTEGSTAKTTLIQREKSVSTSTPSTRMSKDRTPVVPDLQISDTTPTSKPNKPDCPIASVSMRLMRKNEAKSDKDSTTVEEVIDTPSLLRRRTLKDLGPSLKSLARRCSARLSRPSSYAGSSSDPVLQFPEGAKTNGKVTGGGIRTSYSPQPVRPLAPGPDGIVDLQQLQQRQQQQQKQLTTVNNKQSNNQDSPLQGNPGQAKVPIHRRVTLYRPEMTTPSSTCTRSMTYGDDNSKDDFSSRLDVNNDHLSGTNKTTSNSSLSRSKSLSSILRAPKRDPYTLRFANGRGLDLTAIARSKAALDGALPNIEVNATTNVANSGRQETETDAQGSVVVGSEMASEEDEQEWTRRQVVALLAMGRKERVSAKTGQPMSHNTQGRLTTSSLTTKGSSQGVAVTTTTTTMEVPILSPLALEAQEDPVPSPKVPEPSSSSDLSDPCEQISFMLVPKSRYEFQPLVAV
ncbi:hypothetical protein BGZ94_001923 [Podila epigama]|nr:hypothetical protein BGZ94_001923 [Podila epigama]